MITPTHMMIGAVLFARRGDSRKLYAALAGGLVPDLPILAMTLYATRIAGVPEREVFGTLYFSDTWQSVFAVDHGILIWSAALALALWLRRGAGIAFCGAGLAHALVDFFTHASDARPQLEPLTGWVFHSPVSYWEPARHAVLVGMAEAVGIVAFAILLFSRLTRWPDRAAVLTVAMIVLVPMLITGGTHGLHGLG